MVSKILLSALFSLLMILGCSDNGDQYMQNNKQSFTYLALGDSYTIGESVEESERWPIQLRDALQISGQNIDTVKIIAKTGWTTDELNKGIDENDLSGSYDLVSLLIGVNNQYRGRPVDQFGTQFRDLLLRAIKFAGDENKKVFVLSIPDWGATPFARGRDLEKIYREIDQFNNVKEQVCKDLAVKFFNITDISRDALNDLTLVAEDGLHPSAKMYSLWVDRILPDIKSMLEE